MEFEYKIENPESDMRWVPEPQVLVYRSESEITKVVIYFMENTAVTVTEAFAKPKPGKVILSYSAKSSSGAYCASKTLRKLVYTFFNSLGPNKEYEFVGKNT